MPSTDAAVAVIGFARFPAERADEIVPHIKALVEATFRNDGCIAYDVAQDLSDPGLFRFSELWPSAEALAKHQQAPHIGPWRAAAKACGILHREFTVYDVSNPRAI